MRRGVAVAAPARDDGAAAGRLREDVGNVAPAGERTQSLVQEHESRQGIAARGKVAKGDRRGTEIDDAMMRDDGHDGGRRLARLAKADRVGSAALHDSSTPSLTDALAQHSQLSQWVKGLLWADAIAMLLLIPAGLMEIWEQGHLPPGYDPAEDLLGSEILSGCMFSVYLPIGLSLCVLFLRWIYKTTQFLHQFGREMPRFTPGWSVGWFFIPIANVFKPYQVMKETWRLSHPGSHVGNGLLNLWWFLWIASLVLFTVVVAFTLRDNPTDKAWLLWVDQIDSAASVTFALVALGLVSRVDKALQRNFKVGPPASAAP